MLTLRVTDNVAQLADLIGEVGHRHIPFATVLALTRTAQDAKGELRAAMMMELDRPTNFTLNSLFVRAATKSSPVAEVMVKDFAAKGTPAIKYLAPEIYGGDRRMKRFELAMQKAGVMPAGTFAMPAAGCPIDGYGNVPPSFIVRMMSQIGAFSEVGYRANETARGKARRLGRNPRQGDWVVVRVQRGKLKPGIYQRFHFGHGNSLKPVFIFTRRTPTYAPRFKFYETVQRTVMDRFPEQFTRAFNEQLERWGA